jgi:hypothetical protein
MRLIKNSNGLCFLEIEMFEQPVKIHININKLETVFESDGGLIVSTEVAALPKMKGTVAEFFNVLGCYAAPAHDPNEDEVPF